MTETWWFDSRHGEFFFPSRSLDRRCGLPSPDSTAAPLHLVPPSPPVSVCEYLCTSHSFVPEVNTRFGDQLATKCRTFRIKIGPEAGYRH
jgi:hypothetical protein